jgi:hypothetical protein
MISTMPTILTTLAQPEPQASVSPLDAFERLCLEIVQLEAVANAASTAMDECAPPSAARRSFDRAHALIGTAADQATSTVALCEQLKASIERYIAARR